MYTEDIKILSLAICLTITGFVMLSLSFYVAGESLRLALLFYGSVLTPTGLAIFVVVWIKNIITRPGPRLPKPEVLELVKYYREIAEIAEEQKKKAARSMEEFQRQYFKRISSK